MPGLRFHTGSLAPSLRRFKNVKEGARFISSKRLKNYLRCRDHIEKIPEKGRGGMIS